MNQFKLLIAGAAIAVALGMNAKAHAAATRTLDGQQITNGAATLTLPTTTDTLVGRATTDTLTGKTLSGTSNTFTLIPQSAIVGLSGTNSGDVTIGTANGLSLSGQVLSLGVASSSAAGALSSSDWSTFNGKQAAGSYLTALTGDVTATGPGSAAATLATVNSNVGSFANANITVDAKGRVTAVSAGTGAAPSVNNGSAIAQLVSAGTAISLSGLTYNNFVWIAGNGSSVTVTATPSITACTADGQVLRVIGTASQGVTLQDKAALSGSGLSLNGNWTGFKDSVLTLHCDVTQGLWVEDSRR